MKVIVASLNPVKINCVSTAFQKAFPDLNLEVTGINAASEISDQPMTDHETLQGAKNRVKNARLQATNGDYFVGIEGGIDQDQHGMHAFAWIYIENETRNGLSRTANFYLPQPIADLVNQGMELGHADDQFFSRSNSKQKDGAVGILTHNQIDRTQYYEPAVTLALIPFMNPQWY